MAESRKKALIYLANYFCIWSRLMQPHLSGSADILLIQAMTLVTKTTAHLAKLWSFQRWGFGWGGSCWKGVGQAGGI